jgi:hypothetical protein
MLVKQAKAGAWAAPIRDVAAIVVAEFDPESIQDSARRIRESAGQVVREHRCFLDAARSRSYGVPA